VADHLLETHFPGCERSSDEISTTLETASLPTETNWLEASEIISEDKIRWAIAGFGLFKTTGEDGIFPALLKNGIEVLINEFGYIPKPWRKVIFIPKPGRDSYVMAKALRPITLTSLKTMERIVDQNIRTGPLKSFPLHEPQHAYRRSCETALHGLVSRIEGGA
jgi:hypothetical protein